MEDLPAFLGVPLSTHRFSDGSFQYQALIAAIAIGYFRTTVVLPREKWTHYLPWGILLAGMAYTDQPYEWIVSAEIASYAMLGTFRCCTRTDGKPSSIATMIGAIACSAAFSAVVGPTIVSSLVWKTVLDLTPAVVSRTVNYMIPINEMYQAFQSISKFSLPSVLQMQVNYLLFVTFHVQVGMGYMGISFLRREQHRRNLLIRMDVADTDDGEGGATEGGSKTSGNVKKESLSPQEAKLERSRKFQRGAAPFILFTALPYMIQIIVYGNINRFAYICVEHDLHRSVRLYEVFGEDHRMAAMSAETTTSPSAYATSMNSVVSTAYEMFNRKLFSLPKVLLLPGVMSRQPMLVVKVFPVIFFSDWLKAWAVAYMTRQMETMQKEIQNLQAVRTQVEAFDLKNSELLQRSGRQAIQYTRDRWESLTLDIQSREIVSNLLQRSKGFFSFMQNNFVFRVLIDCVLANLIAIGKITAAETFVFSRAIEDAVDMVLMRSRAEAELARMLTEIDRLDELSGIFTKSQQRNLIQCTVPEEENNGNLVLKNLHYSRGPAQAKADHVELNPGVYGLTGANGSGKSTLFRIIMGCDTNRKPIDLPNSINLLTQNESVKKVDEASQQQVCKGGDDGNCQREAHRNMESTETGSPDSSLSIIMPSADIVEISQNFYWPLHSRPIDWIHQDESLDSCASDDIETKAYRIANELHSLEFFQAPRHRDETKPPPTLEQTSEATITRIAKEVQEEKDDWFNDLSGGQKSKVELVRLVFLKDKCPDVLLIDETMAPLDPASKSLVMKKLKAFCEKSIIIVIYHTDVSQGSGDNGEIECIPSNGFFDSNIHLDKGLIHIRDVC